MYSGPCFIGALRKIPFNLADCRVLSAGTGLVVVLTGTLPLAGGGRVLRATDTVCSSVTPLIVV